MVCTRGQDPCLASSTISCSPACSLPASLIVPATRKRIRRSDVPWFCELFQRWLTRHEIATSDAVGFRKIRRATGQLSSEHSWPCFFRDARKCLNNPRMIYLDSLRQWFRPHARILAWVRARQEIRASGSSRTGHSRLCGSCLRTRFAYDSATTEPTDAAARGACRFLQYGSSFDRGPLWKMLSEKMAIHACGVCERPHVGRQIFLCTGNGYWLFFHLEMLVCFWRQSPVAVCNNACIARWWEEK
jgi:hypothetical protein